MPQLLKFDVGVLSVVRTHHLGIGRLLHETEDGFFWRPGQPLTSLAVAMEIARPESREAAVRFVESQVKKEVEETKEEGSEEERMEEEVDDLKEAEEGGEA